MRKLKPARLVSTMVIGVLVAGSALIAGPPAVADETGPRIEPLEIALTDSSTALTADARQGVAAAHDGDLAAGTTVDESAIVTDQIDTGEFTVSALTWDAADSALDENAVYVRVLEASGWSEWTGLDVDDSQPGEVGGSAPFISGVATAIQVQVTGEAAALPADLTLVVAEVDTAGVGGSSASDAGRIGPQTAGVPAPSPSGSPSTKPSTKPTPGSTPEGREGIARGVHPRTDWDKNSPAADWEQEAAPLQAAIVHHTAGTNNYAQADVPGVIASIYYYHAITLGWGDIGYNFLVDKYGGIWEGREGSLDVAAKSMVVGGHAYGSNKGTMGVSVLGEFTVLKPNPAIMDALTKVIEYRFDLAGLNAADKSGFKDLKGAALPRIFGHRDVYATECPGAQIYPRLPGLIQRVGAPKVTASGWFKDLGSWYYLRSDGSTATGWTSVGGTWYYLQANGVMATGWIIDRGSWYYLHSGGAMATGWLNLDGTWFYLQSSGVMATGWAKVGGSWYYFQSGGAMATGWLKLGNTWYYLQPSGAMATGWIKVGGTWYYLDSSGAWV